MAVAGEMLPALLAALLAGAGADYSLAGHCCPPQDCQWTEWSWGACSASCGRGRQTASRQVLRPSTRGGRPCGFVYRASRECEVASCCGAWSAWSCSVTCGAGKRVRGRTGGPGCSGPTWQLGSDCTAGCCPADCTWASWGSWGDCSATCGPGTRTARRAALQSGRCGGVACDPQDGVRQEACPARPACPPLCSWAAWQQWSDFVVVEAGRTRSRSRAELGGSGCSNTEEEEEEEEEGSGEAVLRTVERLSNAVTFGILPLTILIVVAVLLLLIVAILLCWCLRKYCNCLQNGSTTKSVKNGKDNNNFTLIEEFEALDSKKEGTGENSGERRETLSSNEVCVLISLLKKKQVMLAGELALQHLRNDRSVLGAAGPEQPHARAKLWQSLDSRQSASRPALRNRLGWANRNISGKPGRTNSRLFFPKCRVNY